jgi:hypothetical protein
VAQASFTWQFHIHHILPTEVFDDPTLKAMLNAAGFSLQEKGNKIALFASSETADAIKAQIAAGKTYFLEAGFGSSVHPGREAGLSHHGYNVFASEALLDIADNLAPAEQTNAIAKLHSFLAEVSKGTIENVGVESGLSALSIAWGSYDFDASDASTYLSEYNHTFSDALGANNLEERLAKVTDLVNHAHSAGDLSQAQFDKYSALIGEYSLSSSLSSVGGKISAVGVAAVIDIQTNLGVLQPTLATKLAENVAKFVADESGSLSITVFDDMMSAVETHADLFSGLLTSGTLPNSLSELGSLVSNAINNNSGNLIVGNGGGAIGDAVEFLNISYESILEGIQTGDWSAFEANVLTYGAAAVVSAVVTSTTIVAAGVVFGPVGAAAVAAGWAAFGLADALANGSQLLGKLLDDWSDGTIGGIYNKLVSPLVTTIRDPLVLDLDDDGIELSTLDGSSVHFDYDGDGFAERTGWVASDDGLLVLDANGNGVVDGASELFGSSTQDGFAVLEMHDTNGDGVIDGADDEFPALRIWRDLDQDAVSDAGELVSLADAGISAISLTRTNPDATNAGHTVGYQAAFERADGSSGTAQTIYFQTDRQDTVADNTPEFVPAPGVEKLPQLAGSGQINLT